MQDYIDKQYSWRRKELTNFYNTTFTSRKSIRETMLKLLVVLLYSHWEGFVKLSSFAYCELLNSKGVKYKYLINNLKVFCILNKFDGGFPSTKFSSYLDIICTIDNEMNSKLTINPEKHISTQSNLNSTILKDIVQKIGLDYSQYELHEKLIDESFLKLRNAFAHGEQREIDEQTLKSLYSHVNSMIDTFKNQILNAAYNKSYLIKKIGP